MKKHYTAKELEKLKLKSLPKYANKIRSKAEREVWEVRDRQESGGGKEYAFASLPAEVQAEIRLKLQQQLINQVAKPTHEQRETAIALRDVTRLHQKQRDTADARLALVAYVHQLEREGMNRSMAVALVSRQSQKGGLPEHLKRMAELAPAKQRKSAGFGQRALHGWVLDAERCNTPTERFARLAPQHMGRGVKDPATCPWLADFMAVYRNTNGVNVTEAYRQFVAIWAINRSTSPPTLRQVRSMLKKLPRHIKEMGRRTGAQMRALKTYVKRDWSNLHVNDVWVGDGHSMKMKVRHPDHGQPFTPELTLIIDAASRYVVGWSLAYSESTIAVADALRAGFIAYGLPAIYYSDKGSGQTNKTFDADVTGILPRLGIHHETGIPGNPQGRGIIERLNKTLALRIARQFDTYYGEGADADTVRKTLTGTKSLAKAIADGKTPEQYTDKQHKAQGKLPTWEQLLSAIETAVNWYNHEHRHREIHNATPFQMRTYLLDQPDAQMPVPMTEAEAREMYRPEFIRRVQRGWLRHHNNDYWHADLEDYDGEDVIVGVDIHHAETVIIRNKDSRDWICDAVWNGNKRDAFPQTLVEKARQDRAKAAEKRLADKQAQIDAEKRPTLEAQANEMWVVPDQPENIETRYDFLDIDISKLKKAE